MQLNKIDILNFKNIPEAKLEFSPGVNCLLGMNGMGKSNLLEAVYFLSMARPLSSMPESALVRHGQEMMMVKGDYLTDTGGEEHVSCGLVKGKGKTVKRNGKEYPRISEHIGRFPIVTVLPADSEIVSGSGEQRRRMLDMVISQADPLYLAQLIKYNRALESRNKMLRAGVRDALLYESIETGLCAAAAEIHSSRRRWTEEIRPVFERYYSMISSDAERASIKYKSSLNDDGMQNILNSTRQKDIVLGFTSQGVHRDDLITGLGDYSMRRLGSQGQVKSFTIALKFAIFDYLRKNKGMTPILLLDDIFDKLDSTRVGRIMEAVSGGESFGQIFITDTNREHLDETIASIRSESRLFEVKEGEFKTVDR
ncbi:MAG: DNA replication and repair protein RecF [Muribaculaceae bacterium]|nr:DNA replication and repair protein RecF [Muribaculaceae bacterium]